MPVNILYMKSLAMAATLILIIATGISCKKNAHGTIIQGKWELTKTSGMAGTINVPPGSGNFWQFSGNKFYEYFDDTLANSGTFEVIDYPNYQPQALISGQLKLHGDYEVTYNFYLPVKNTLIIDFNSFVDGPINTYARR